MITSLQLQTTNYTNIQLLNTLAVHINLIKWILYLEAQVSTAVVMEGLSIELQMKGCRMSDAYLQLVVTMASHHSAATLYLAAI